MFSAPVRPRSGVTTISSTFLIGSLSAGAGTAPAAPGRAAARPGRPCICAQLLAVGRLAVTRCCALRILAAETISIARVICGHIADAANAPPDLTRAGHGPASLLAPPCRGSTRPIVDPALKAVGGCAQLLDQFVGERLRPAAIACSISGWAVRM